MLKLLYTLDLTSYQKEFKQYLDQKKWIREPKNLYEPIDYIIQLSGKRIRPILTLMARDILSGTYTKAFPTTIDTIDYNYQNPDEISSGFTFVYSQLHTEVMDF